MSLQGTMKLSPLNCLAQCVIPSDCICLILHDCFWNIIATIKVKPVHSNRPKKKGYFYKFWGRVFFSPISIWKTILGLCILITFVTPREVLWWFPMVESGYQCKKTLKWLLNVQQKIVNLKVKSSSVVLLEGMFNSELDLRD